MAEDIFNQRSNSFNVASFRKKISGVAFASKFYFRFSDKKFIGDLVGSGSNEYNKFENLFFYSDDNLTLPNRSINQNSEYRYANGFRIQTASQTKYGDGNISLSFRLDDKYDILEIFNKWINKIHNPKTGYLSFYDNYTTGLEAYQLPYNIKMEGENSIEEYVADNKGVYKLEFIRCYPISIGNLEFSHQSKNVTKISVELYYSGIKYNEYD